VVAVVATLAGLVGPAGPLTGSAAFAALAYTIIYASTMECEVVSGKGHIRPCVSNGIALWDRSRGCRNA